MSIKIEGVDSINDFWCYLNGDKTKHYVASGDGVNIPDIDWKDSDFIEVYVRYGLDDKYLFRIKFNSSLTKVYIVRNHRRINNKLVYYCFNEPLYKGNTD